MLAYCWLPGVEVHTSVQRICISKFNLEQRPAGEGGAENYVIQPKNELSFKIRSVIF
jgi:hypothetical protein